MSDKISRMSRFVVMVVIATVLVLLLTMVVVAKSFGADLGYWKAQQEDFINKWNQVAVQWNDLGDVLRSVAAPSSPDIRKKMVALDKSILSLRRSPVWARSDKNAD